MVSLLNALIARQTNEMVLNGPDRTFNTKCKKINILDISSEENNMKLEEDKVHRNNYHKNNFFVHEPHRMPEIWVH